MNYKNAFKCHKCPQSNDENGCPMWWEYVQEDHMGKIRNKKQCGYQALPDFLMEVISNSQRPAAEIGAMRKELMKIFNKIIQLASGNSQKQIEDNNG